VSVLVPSAPVPLMERARLLLHDLARFLVVGGLCFGLDLLVSNLLHFGVGLGPTTSKTAATALATLASYLGNRWWALAHRVDEDAGQSRDVLVFVLVNALGLVITLVPVDVAHYGLGLTGATSFNVSSIIGTAAATAFRFWAYRRYVFTSAAAERAALV
jgi:putative flippase GtrA